jgi:hypothetical protein
MSKISDLSKFLIRPYVNQSQPWVLQVDTKASILRAHFGDYDFALVDNWDGSGAKRIEHEVLSLAEQVLSDYSSQTFLAEVCPGREGSLSFVWDDGGKNYVYLDIGPQNALHLFYNVEGHPKWEGVSLADDVVMHANLVKALFFTRSRFVQSQHGDVLSRQTFVTSFPRAA